MELDDDIVQDFLVEGSEILELLDSQLVELEACPDDRDRLNAVFRGFHTLKGGAGFLGLEHLVAVSHKCEDLFDLLRKGALAVDSDLMDAFLQVLDVLRLMFDELRAGQMPQAAPPALLARLAGHVAALDATTAASLASPQAPVPDAIDPMIAIIDELNGPPAAASGADEFITEEEFDALLDQLQGRVTQPAGRLAAASASQPDLITDEEFEALLDQLHGAAPPAPRAALPGTPAAAAAEPRQAARRERGARAETGKDTTVRVETETLDRIMNMVGELVLIRNRLSNLQASIGNHAMTETVANLDVVTSELQMTAMKTRMQPIKKVFGRFPRVVRDLARSLEKEIVLETVGEDTDLDKNLVEALADPLIHLVRNAIDHGIERPAERLAAGKPAVGTLRLAAEQAGDQIKLTISDDGRGIDHEALRRKVVDNQLLDADAAARLTERECFELIFLPGFSTKQEISDISGRGVGMDVVKTRIGQLNGTITIDSAPGRGTTISVVLPLTLAIMPTLMVILGSQVFALPLVNVQEIINFQRSQAREVDGRKTLVVRGRALPLFYLSSWLVQNAREFTEPSGHVVVVRVGNHCIGLLVDDLIGQEEVVIKPLGALLAGTRGLSGATITGDGKIALIVDLPSLLEAYAQC